jgi:hypothetical protein
MSQEVEVVEDVEQKIPNPQMFETVSNSWRIVRWVCQWCQGVCLGVWQWVCQVRVAVGVLIFQILKNHKNYKKFKK